MKDIKMNTPILSEVAQLLRKLADAIEKEADTPPVRGLIAAIDGDGGINIYRCRDGLSIAKEAGTLQMAALTLALGKD